MCEGGGGGGVEFEKLSKVSNHRGNILKSSTIISHRIIESVIQDFINIAHIIILFILKDVFENKTFTMVRENTFTGNKDEQLIFIL